MRSDIYQLTEFIKNYTNIIPQNFLEIGSRDGNDALYVSNYWDISPDNCYIIEPHPTHYNNIINKYPKFQTFNFAASDMDQETIFNAGIEDTNSGASSLLNRINHDNFISNQILIQTYKISTFMKQIQKFTFDLIKIDVEGFGLQVLLGFDDFLSDIKCIQIESEHKEAWQGQHNYQKVLEYMSEKNFIVAHDYILCSHQKDTLFLNKNYEQYFKF